MSVYSLQADFISSFDELCSPILPHAQVLLIPHPVDVPAHEIVMSALLVLPLLEEQVDHPLLLYREAVLHAGDGLIAA